ncbi:MAG: c-type cytochrome [Epsilonproteobacteria bacterium]|nr:c-type cytochrome [Campylobacterota bacterium]
MRPIWILLVPLILFALAYFIKHKETAITSTQSPSHTHQSALDLRPDCPECFERYVEWVINEGLDLFKYPSGPMPGGTVSPQEAKKIAAFLATLQGYSPSHPEWVQEGKALFYGNCTGCHGPEGKGQRGYFPDLTKKPLEGYERLMKHSIIK